MPVLSVTQAPTGLVSVTPSVLYIYTNDTYAVVTTTGYLDTYSKQNLNVFDNTEMALVYTSDDGPVWLRVVVTTTHISLVAPSIPGQTTLPTIANHIIVSTNTAGTLANLTGTAINNGSLQAGLPNGTPGTLISLPGTAANGSLIIAAANAGGAFNTTISNGTMGQSSVYTLPDVVSATGRILVAATATPFTSGNFPQASGTGGLMVDSGLAVSNVVSKVAANTFSGSGQIILQKANGTEASNAVTASGNAGVITTSSLTTGGGLTYTITWTNTKITATSVFAFCIQGGTNTVKNIQFSCVPGSGSATLIIYNLTAATALDGTILIGYTVL